MCVCVCVYFKRRVNVHALIIIILHGYQTTFLKTFFSNIMSALIKGYLNSLQHP